MATTDIENTPMFCFQCEQTVRPTGCTRVGVCSKNPEVAAKQDLIVAGAKCLGALVDQAQTLGLTYAPEVNHFLAFSLFMTLTNTNFEPAHHDAALAKMAEYIAHFKSIIAAHLKIATTEVLKDNNYIDWTIDRPANKNRIDVRQKALGDTVVGLHETIVYGLKGLSAYTYHAIRLNHAPNDVLPELPKILAFLSKEPTDVEEILKVALRVGELSHTTMGHLDAGNTSTFGHPEPTPVMWGPRAGKCILVSGHDLLDLYHLLKQTEGKGINIFTHGEMLPCNAYPELKKFKHLVGHYGTAWQNQKKEFAAFPGPILMTTNCIMAPTANYEGRIWATGPVGFPKVKKITAEDVDPVAPKKETKETVGTIEYTNLPQTDFSPIIEQALAMDGFPATTSTTITDPATDTTTSYPDPNGLRKITIGFGHHTVVPLVPHVVESAVAGKLRRVFVVGGCDGDFRPRSYFTDFAKLVPQDCAVMTLACGKFRFNHLGMDAQLVPGTQIPRLMDVGQCNDGYSAIAIAAKLAEALKVGVADLPLSVCLSWYEQKAVADLLALLFVGVRNIKLGPRPPAFITADALGVLTSRFGLTLTSTPEKDMAEFLGK